MKKDGILYRTGILAGDLWTVLSFYSGKDFVPYRTPEWVSLSKTIDSSPFSFWEYFFWLIHYYEGPNELGLIVQKNMVCSPKLWKEFLEWKEDADRFARLQMEIHIDEARTSARLRSIEDVLLDRAVEIGPVARVEVALMLKDPMPVIQVYALSAGDVLRGLPEFIDHAPRLREYLEDPNAARQFLPC